MNTLPTVINLSDIEIVEQEPRVKDTVLAKALGFERPRKIRELIERNISELARFGDIAPHVGRVAKTTATIYHLNEKQALYITAKSNTPTAADITVEMVEVFAAWRQGHLQSVEPSEISEQLPALITAEISRALAPIQTQITQALTYRTGDDKGGTKDVATGKQVGRLIQMVEDLSKTITLTPRPSHSAASEAPVHPQDLKNAISLMKETLGCYNAELFDQRAHNVGRMMDVCDALVNRTMALFNEKIGATETTLQRINAIEERQETILHMLQSASEDSALLRELKAVTAERDGYKRKYHGVISHLGRDAKLKAKALQPDLATA